MIERLNALLGDTGLFVRAGFHPEAADGVPALPGGAPARTVVLVGNAGTDMWDAFVRGGDRRVRDPLDSWLRPRVEAAAVSAGAHPVFPNDGPPFVPVQDWAARAEPVYRSPIGIMIHPDYGLWHVYRAALLFADRIDVPPGAAEREERPSPCESCANRPCLTVCPADAFLPDRFDAPACAAHVESAAGTNCRERGCLARRACPVGREYRYGREQQEFHTAAMLAAVKRGYGAG
tara:strand:- start:2068 stop:2769 length:702 start_codon:yes stop_codon:yes gene_type:complete